MEEGGGGKKRNERNEGNEETREGGEREGCRVAGNWVTRIAGVLEYTHPRRRRRFSAYK